jgi:transcriptional regulator with XRE-family HTH domain
MDAKNREFIGLVKAAGWSQAETARRLHITPGAVSQIFNGRTRPHPATLNLLKLILVVMLGLQHEHHPAIGAKLQPWEIRLLEALRGLPGACREALLAAFHKTIRAVQTRHPYRS